MKGKIALFNDPHEVFVAAKRLRHLNIKKMDAFSPFPIHGMEAAMGIKRSWISYSALFFGLTGGSLGLLFQYWTQSVDWHLNIGGKPAFSWPSFIPVTFELTILFSGVTTVLILWAMIIHHGLKTRKLDPRITDDQFALFVDSSDVHYHEEKIDSVFKECNAQEIKHLD